MGQLTAWISKKLSGCFTKKASAMALAQTKMETLALAPAQLSKKALAMSPDWYLEHARACLVQVLQMTSGSHSIKVRWYQRQCKYLVENLELAINSINVSLGRSLSPEHKVDCLEALKFLFQLAKEVESILKDCCSDEMWVLAALTPATMVVRVSTLGWYLKLCTEFVRNNNKLGIAWQIFIEFEGLREVELHYVKEISILDEAAMLSFLESLTFSNTQKYLEVKLATFLLKRLKAIKKMSTSDSPQASNLELWDLDGVRFRQKELLGRGSSGSVFKIKLFGTMEAAVKNFYGQDNPNFKIQVSFLARFSHPNIVSFHGYMKEKRLCRVIMELMEGNLHTLMVQKCQENVDCAPFRIWEACDIMIQVAKAVHYMHQNGVACRNLKSINILVKSLKEDDIEFTCVKLGSFELAKRTRSITYSMQTYNLGTVRWMAPEVINLNRAWQHESNPDLVKYPFKADVFSFGLVCFEILTGDVPFSNIASLKEMKRNLLDGQRPKLPTQCPQNLKNLIESCWDQEPNTRPSFNEICEELLYIKCSLLLEPFDHDQRHETTLPVSTLHLPKDVSKFRAEYSSLKVVKQIGKGGLDIVTVYLSNWDSPNGTKQVAQKRFIGSHNKCFVNEVSILANLEHPHIISLFCYATDRRSCSIVMERMDEDLHDMMLRKRWESNTTSKGLFSNDEAIHVILQIAKGMDYVHEKNVVHGDLKSCNILVKNSTTAGWLDVKVADFGLAIKMKSKHIFLNKDAAVGTIRWMAPEVISIMDDVASSGIIHKYDPFKSDVYSFGMVCYEILAGEVPFADIKDLTEVKKKILDGVHPPLPKWTPPILNTLIEQCWQDDPRRRPTFATIVKNMT